MVQFQSSKKLFIHITFSKFTTSRDLLLTNVASIHCYLKKVLNLNEIKSRVERKVEVSLPKQNNLLETNPH